MIKLYWEYWREIQCAFAIALGFFEIYVIILYLVGQ